MGRVRRRFVVIDFIVLLTNYDFTTTLLSFYLAELREIYLKNPRYTKNTTAMNVIKSGAVKRIVCELLGVAGLTFIKTPYYGTLV
jgi:hypothetical protein